MRRRLLASLMCSPVLAKYVRFICISFLVITINNSKKFRSFTIDCEELLNILNYKKKTLPNILHLSSLSDRLTNKAESTHTTQYSQHHIRPSSMKSPLLILIRTERSFPFSLSIIIDNEAFWTLFMMDMAHTPRRTFLYHGILSWPLFRSL